MPLSQLNLVDGPAQERATLNWEGRSFVERFEKGLFSIAVDMRVDGESDPIRVWLSCSPEAHSNRIFHELMLQAIHDENQIEESFCLVARMAVESFDGIRKGHRGKGVFTSLINGRTLEISPPFWWLTGRAGIDRSTYRSQVLENGGDDRIDTRDDLYRHPMSPHLTAKLREMEWSIHQGGFFVDPLNSGIEVIEAFYGPVQCVAAH